MTEVLSVQCDDQTPEETLEETMESVLAVLDDEDRKGHQNVFTLGSHKLVMWKRGPFVDISLLNGSKNPLATARLHTRGEIMYCFGKIPRDLLGGEGGKSDVSEESLIKLLSRI